MGKLAPADVRAYLARDWAGARTKKRAVWRERVARGDLREALAASDQLREWSKQLDPGWGSEEERQADLESHRRVAQALYKVPRPH